MVSRWQLQEAKQKLSEVVRAAQNEGPQILTKHGQDVVVMLSVAEFSRLAGEPDFKEFLTSGPDFEALELTRSAESASVIDLQ